jgi:hypothetical protein
MTTTTTSPSVRHVHHERRDQERREPRAERTVRAAEQIVDAAVDVGRSWAAYGLRIGKLALETHAHTMARVADALGALQHAIDDRAETREAGAYDDEGHTSEPAPSSTTFTTPSEAA